MRSGLKINPGKSKVIVLGGEEGLERKVFIFIFRICYGRIRYR